MPANIQHESNNLWVLRASGLLKKAELEHCQGAVGADIDAGGQPRVLVVLENFEGWESGVDWDVDFLFSKGRQIGKIAIVGDPRFESEALMFAGANIRPTPVKYFRAGRFAEARAWLAE